jgi:hypothetical protein
MATRPALPALPAAPGPRPSTRRSRPARTRTRANSASLSAPLAPCVSRRSAELAGTSVALSPDIPVLFDQPFGAHHKLLGQWALSLESALPPLSRPAARRHVERAFDVAVRDILDCIDLVDLRVVVLHGGEEGGPPAIAIICDTLGQIDLGWIEVGDAPISWRAAAYQALDKSLSRLLPIYGYEFLLEEIAIYYWDGETEDEAARQSLIAYHGADRDDLENMTLPSEMNARRPGWMIAANAAPSKRLPPALRRKLDALAQASEALGGLESERNAWNCDFEIILDYIPGYDECASLPPLTLVPFEQFARELDDIARNGMEMGFMDIAGLCPLAAADRVDDWFTSLRLGTRLLAAAQDLIRLDPTSL